MHSTTFELQRASHRGRSASMLNTLSSCGEQHASETVNGTGRYVIWDWAQRVVRILQEKSLKTTPSLECILPVF